MRIAVAQLPGARLDRWHDTLAEVADALRQAHTLGAQLVVLPECVWPAYCLGSTVVYRAARAGGLPGDEFFLDYLRGAARKLGLAICAGYVEEQGDALFNAAALIDADGNTLGVHRKCFLWDFDHDYFASGESLRPIDSPWGPVGLMICADARLPEIPATLAARGARLLLQPTAWVNAGLPAQPWNPQPDFLIPARAAEFGVPVASASKWGQEGNTTFVGSSLICDAGGKVLVQCGTHDTLVAAADVEPAPPRAPRVSEAERALLLSEQPATLPRSGACVLNLRPRSFPDRAVLEFVRDGAGGEIPVLSAVLGNPPADARLSTALTLAGPVSEPVAIHGALLAAVAALDAGRFAPLRCLSLQGVYMALVFGADTPTAALRARASENRIFVVGVGAGGWHAIDPRGAVLGCATWELGDAAGVTVRLDLAQAATKEVARRTDVVIGRNAAIYGF